MVIGLHAIRSAEALAQVPHRYWHELKQTASSWLGAVPGNAPRRASTIGLSRRVLKAACRSV